MINFILVSLALLAVGVAFLLLENSKKTNGGKYLENQVSAMKSNLDELLKEQGDIEKDNARMIAVLEAIRDSQKMMQEQINLLTQVSLNEKGS